MNSHDTAADDSGTDALTYVLSEEPVPEALANDPRFAREYAAAGAQTDEFRHGLALLARELFPQPVAPQPRRRRPVLALAASAAVLALGGGLSVYLTEGGGGSPAASLSTEGYVACSRLIVIGTVTAVHSGVDEGSFSVNLSVERYLKPSSGSGDVTVRVEDQGGGDTTTEADWPVGTRALVTVLSPPQQAETVVQETGKGIDTKWASLEQALPKSKTVTCSNTDTQRLP